MSQHHSKPRRIASWIVVGLISALFIASSMPKILGMEAVVENFEKYGLGGMALVIGIGELASALLYLIPRTASLGVLLLSALMGGAIVVHMSHGESYLFQSVILVLVWAGYWLRYPEMLVSFARRQES